MDGHLAQHFKMSTMKWKNSASILLITRHSQTGITKSSSNLKIPSKLQKSNYDYKVLFLQRGAQSKFMPSTFVFPGGVMDKADLSLEWKEIFKEIDPAAEQLWSKFKLEGKLRPFHFSNDITQYGALMANDDTLPMEVATRICAIRETYEESGILLARKNKLTSETLPLKFSEVNDGHDVRNWRKEVAKNANQFISLCREKNLCPDIWGLHEWSNWLTPTIFGKKRFNTVFYTCFLENMPEFSVDEQEVTKAKWYTPADVLSQYVEKKLVLPPPQNYETRRVGQIDKIDELADFSQKRALQGVPCTFPVCAAIDDGLLHLLPGDDAYPKNPDFLDHTLYSISGTMQNLRATTKNLHRGEGKNPYDYRFQYYCNIKLDCNHLAPISEDNLVFSPSNLSCD